MPEQLNPIELFSRYRFILGAFGLDALHSAFYRGGEELKPNDGSDSTLKKNDRGEPNMHTGFSRGGLLRPVKTGKQAISELGTPVFSDLIIHKQDQTEAEGIHLVHCIMDVNQTKNIVKTTIQGRNGTVKEYISDGDYIITLRGAIVRTFKSNYPKEEIRIFLDLLKQNKSLKVTGEYLLQFGIYEVVVDSYRMAQETGKQNVQTFEINLSSDTPLLLKKKDANR